MKGFGILLGWSPCAETDRAPSMKSSWSDGPAFVCDRAVSAAGFARCVFPGFPRCYYQYEDQRGMMWIRLLFCQFLRTRERVRISSTVARIAQQRLRCRWQLAKKVQHRPPREEHEAGTASAGLGDGNRGASICMYCGQWHGVEISAGCFGYYKATSSNRAHKTCLIVSKSQLLGCHPGCQSFRRF